MNRNVLGFASLFVATTLVACGGGSTKYPDATVPPDATADTGKPTDGGAGTGGLVPPVPAPTSKLIVPAGASLIGTGPESCTRQDPAPGDRWCAFTRPGTTLGFHDLWVINVTKAAAGAVKCDTTDASCLRLSTGLYEDVDNGFRNNGFDGDTLIYYEEPSRSPDGFLGVIKAWRPGWTGGRKLTSNTGVFCAGQNTSAAVVCYDNLTPTATTSTADMHAGILTDVDTGLLPKVDTLLIAVKDDAANGEKWRADLSPDGKRVAWSTRADAAGVEVLRVQTIGDDASRAVVAQDVSQWTITPDGASWLWLSKFNHDQTGAPSGTLESAPFPAGTSPKLLAATVGEYESTGPKGVLYRTKMKEDAGDLILMPDRDAPATITMLDQGVVFVFDHTKDGTKAAYTKNVESLGDVFSSVPIFDIYVATNNGMRPCPLAATAIGYLTPNFLDSGDYAAWGRLNSVTGEVEGIYTTLATCTSKKFATEIFSWAPIGSEGYVFLDELSLDPDHPDLREATLRYSKLDNGALPAKGTSIQTRAQFTYTPLLPTLAAVVYEVSSSAGNDGLYINAALPFTTKPVVPPPDAGTPPTDGPADAPAAETGSPDAGTDAAPDAPG